MIRTIPGLLLMFALALFSCKKESKPVPVDTATASFTINGAAQDSLVVGTYDQMLLINTTARVKRSLWNFGQGNSSTATDTVISFSKPGIYTVTLTITDSLKQTGHSSTLIRVLDRKIKTIEITAIDDVISAEPQPSKPADHFWVELKLGENNVHYSFPSNPPFTLPTPIVYKSAVLTSLTPDKLPFEIQLGGGISLNFPALAVGTLSGLGYIGAGYGIELYRASGKDTVLLSSSYAARIIAQSGGTTWPVADPSKDMFVAQYGDLRLLCDYE